MIRIDMSKKASNNDIFILTESNNWHWRIKNKDYTFRLYIVNTVIKRCEDKKSMKQDKWKRCVSHYSGAS